MKPKIIARDKLDLRTLIRTEIFSNGLKCDLNHIDVSRVTDFSEIFALLEFYGDISQWNVSYVKNMSQMFYFSTFNGDISNWDVSNVVTMEGMFSRSKFNQDISKWNVSKVENITAMFLESEFIGDISNWKPYKIKNFHKTFENCDIELPYWFKYTSLDERKKAIDSYYLSRELNKELIIQNNINKKIKI